MNNAPRRPSPFSQTHGEQTVAELREIKEILKTIAANLAKLAQRDR